MVAAAAAALALLVAGHNASQGKSAFVVAADGHVDITVHLLELDLPELCDVDFGVTAQKRPAMEARLESCVAEGFPRWLRLRLGDESCPISAGRARHGQGLDIVLEAFATCPGEPAGRTLTLDWGLFASSSLDHQSTATVTLPGAGKTTMALLSKRKNKLTIDVPTHRAEVAAAVFAGVAFVVVVVGLLLVRRRGHRRGRRPRVDPTP